MQTRYQKQMRLAEFGQEGQEKLRKARVLVIGCGGLGCSVLPLLCAAGVGFIRIYDHDIVEESNLHRQFMYSMDNLGQSKALAMKSILQKQNPDCHIEAYVEKFTPAFVQKAMQAIDIVIDAADNFMVTYVLSDACYKASVPFISASVLEYHGYVGAFCGGKPSYRAVFPQPVLSNVNCNNAGVMGPVVASLGSIQAQMALNIILHLSKPTLGHLWQFDCFSWKVNQFCFDRAEEPDPEMVIPFLDVSDLDDKDYLIELRDQVEAPVLIRSDVIRVLPNDIEHTDFPKDRRIIFICKTGLRATRAAFQLQQKGFRQLGILIDP